MDDIDQVVAQLETNQPGFYHDPDQPQEVDYTNAYNTKLNPDEENNFNKWAQDNNKANDLYDYDLRGAWKSGAATAANGHLPDTWKKPNHPTFSDQSMYNGIGGNVGGKWSDNAGKWSFTPGQTNLQLFGKNGLKDYFQNREPDATLVLPVGQ